MKSANMIKFMVVAASTLFFACGGGGGSNNTVPPVTQQVDTGKVVNGIAQAGIFSSGQAVFKGYSGANKNKEYTLQTVTFALADKGMFSGNIGSYSGVLKVEVSGTYIDEATQQPVTVPPTAPLRAALPSTSVTSGVTMLVTPLTDIAVSKAIESSSTLMDESVATCNKAVSTFFDLKGGDIMHTVPAPITPETVLTSSSSSSDVKQQAYGYTIALEWISHYVADYAARNSPGSSNTATSMVLQAALPVALNQISSGISIDKTTQAVTVASEINGYLWDAQNKAMGGKTYSVPVVKTCATPGIVKISVIDSNNNPINTATVSLNSGPPTNVPPNGGSIQFRDGGSFLVKAPGYKDYSFYAVAGSGLIDKFIIQLTPTPSLSPSTTFSETSADNNICK